jgi:putative toxin-antitoxin system antitoxin component (TIGR02293 family)
MTLHVESIALDRLEDLLSLPRSELIEAIRAGLPAEIAGALAQGLDLSQEELAILLGLTPRTLQRRVEHGRLGLADSERLWELARLWFRSIEVLESEEGARHWFKSPIQALGQEIPLVLAQTVVGRRELENVLGRIEHGVFS